MPFTLVPKYPVPRSPGTLHPHCFRAGLAAGGWGSSSHEYWVGSSSHQGCSRAVAAVSTEGAAVAAIRADVAAQAAALLWRH